MEHVPLSSGSPSLARLATLDSDTVVFSHTKLPSRQSSVVAGSASPAAACRGLTSRRDDTSLHQPLAKKFRVEAPRGNGVQRMTVRVIKYGDRLGFGVRHDRYKRLQVSTLQGCGPQLRVGDTLLSVNGVDLTGHEFLTAIGHLKATRPGELLFEIERTERGVAASATPIADARSLALAATGAMVAQTSVNPWVAASAVAVPVSRETTWSQNGASALGQAAAERNLANYAPTVVVPQTGVPPASIPVTSSSGNQANGTPQPRKRARPSQRVVTMLDDNGQPVNVTALLADLKKERAEKAALEEKNAGLRKRLQRMLIENDEVRVRASNEVSAAQEKAKLEVVEAQKQLATARAEIRLQDRGPNVASSDLIESERAVWKAQLDRLKKAEADRTALLTTRYRSECRIATADAQRVLDSVVELFRTKLRHVGRLCRDTSTSSPDLEVTCEGVRRLVFMKLLSMTHDFAFYTSAAFHSPDPVQHTMEQEQFSDLFGNSLCHEERAGLFYVAAAPMVVAFDPKAESVVFKCGWAEQNALRDLARNFRF